MRSLEQFDGLEAIHAGLTAVIGCQCVNLMMPWDTFGSTRAWLLFARMMPEEHWSVVFFFVCVLGVAGVKTLHNWLRIVSALIVSATHAMMAVLFLASNPSGGASWTFGVLALMGFYLLLRHMRNA